MIESNSTSNNYINDELMKTKLKYPKKSKNYNKFNINKSCELNNKKYINFKLSSRNTKKNEIFNIYKHNVDYFQQKYKQKKKIVLNTIKYPEKLIKLNNKLPEVKYDDEYISQIQKPVPMPKFYLSPHKILPKIRKNNNNSNKKESIKEIKDKIYNNNIKENEEVKNDIKDNNNNNVSKNKKNSFINNINNKSFLINTLQLKINQNHPFNYKGEIDIIVEE